MKTLLSALTVLAIVVGSTAAFADSGDGPQFNLPQPIAASGPAREVVSAATLNHDVDVQAEPVFAGTPAAIDQNGGGGFLLTNGNEAPLQTANSAPAGFGVDTVQLAAGAASFPHYAFGLPVFPHLASR